MSTPGKRIANMVDAFLHSIFPSKSQLSLHPGQVIEIIVQALGGKQSSTSDVLCWVTDTTALRADFMLFDAPQRAGASGASRTAILMWMNMTV